MRSMMWLVLPLAWAAAAPAAAPALAIVRPVVSLMEGGAPEAPGYEYIPGQILFFSCRISGYTKTSEEKVHVAYSVQAFDPKGVPLTELYKNDLATEVTAQDKDWMPKIETEVVIPSLVAAGSYKILVKAEDVQAKTSAELSVPFVVRARTVQASDTLVIRNFRFLRNEDDSQGLDKPVYRPGDSVWGKFDITGFKYGPNNKVDLSYVVSVIGAGGKVLWTQPDPAVEQSESFYPKLYVAADMGINLQKTVRPGEYTIGVVVKDATGGQTYEGRYTFTVE